MVQKQNRSLVKIIVLAVAIVGVATVGLCFAKMRSAESSPEKSEVDIAKWSVSITGSEDFELVAGDESKNYELTVTNSSDTSSNYALVLKNVPSGVIVKMGDNTQTSVGEDLYFDIDSPLAINSSETHLLSFTAPLDIAIATDNEGNEITASVQFAQKEPE